jgi:hypothetical protein
VKRRFNLVSKSSSHKGINYGDGYFKTIFIFDKEITEDEFIQYLKDEGYEIKPKTDEWWNDYTVITGGGTQWQWKKVLVYTD